MEKKLELLAPAGSFESLKAAAGAGADAVYMGGSRFGARAYADNPADEELLEAIDYAHLHGMKLYLTINTLLKEKELTQELYAYLKPCYEHGLDAVIIQDAGVMQAVRTWFPGLALHASTQMTLCGTGGVKLMKEAGAKRVVLARELSLVEIQKIHESVDVEIESFVHGALCYCYSGQCLFSSILGGRSGNRGRCAQPCRLSYTARSEEGRVVSGKKENRLLSPKDICTLDLIPGIAQAGVCSLKIEGRMKRPEYVAGVVRIYRKYVDHYLKYGAQDYHVQEKDREELSLLFNRDGFSRGYYEQRNGRNMMALTGSEPSIQEKKAYESLIASLRKQYVDTEKKIPVKGILSAQADQPMELKIRTADDKVSLTVYGACPQTPKNRPMEEENLRKQMKKTGESSFFWEDLKVEIKSPLFVPVQALNSLRRDALEQLKEKILHTGMPRQPAVYPDNANIREERKTQETCKLHISIETKEQLAAVLKEVKHLKKKKEAPLTAVYIEAECLEEELETLADQMHGHGLKAYVSLPAVFRMDTAARYEKHQDFWRGLSVDGYVVRNLETYEFLERIQWEKEKILDHNMYIFNHFSRRFWREKGADYFTAPLELNAKELRDILAEDGIQIIYGRYPMMVTANCLHKTLGQCKKTSGQWTLTDRYQKKIPVKNYCRDCYNILYNSQPLYLFDQMEALGKLGAGAYRILFTTESEREVYTVLRCWMEGEKPEKDFTRGHFKRGVE